MICRLTRSPAADSLLLFFSRRSVGQMGGLLASLSLVFSAPFTVDAAGRHLAAQPASPSQQASPGPVLTPTTGLVTIESDRQMADNSTGIVTAVGNVRIVYADQRVVATARQAQYFSREGRIVLSGDVDVVQDDGHTLRAEQLVYVVGAERLEAYPAAGQQVTSRYRLGISNPMPGASEARP